MFAPENCDISNHHNHPVPWYPLCRLSSSAPAHIPSDKRKKEAGDGPRHMRKRLQWASKQLDRQPKIFTELDFSVHMLAYIYANIHNVQIHLCLCIYNDIYIYTQYIFIYIHNTHVGGKQKMLDTLNGVGEQPFNQRQP